MANIFRESNKGMYTPKTVPDATGKINRQIIIEFIDHKEQRYDTVGDYYDSGFLGEILVKVSKLKDQRFEMMIAIHELVEMTLCRDAGITNEQIDRFDLFYDRDGEPGDDPACPYGPQHRFATFIEHEMCRLMGIDWNEYNDYIGSISFDNDPTNVVGNAGSIPAASKDEQK